MAHTIGVSGLRKITSDMVDDAMDLMRRSRKNLKEEDGADGEAAYEGEWTMDGIATLTKDNTIGIAARVEATPAGPINDIVDVGGEAGTDISLKSASTGDAKITFRVTVSASMREVANTTSRDA